MCGVVLDWQERGAQEVRHARVREGKILKAAVCHIKYDSLRLCLCVRGCTCVHYSNRMRVGFRGMCAVFRQCCVFVCVSVLCVCLSIPRKQALLGKASGK